MQFPELDQEAIKARPLRKNPFSKGQRSVDASGQVLGQLNRDLSKVPMLGCDGLEWRDDPLDTPRIKPKHHIFEFRRFREVDWSCPRPTWKE